MKIGGPEGHAAGFGTQAGVTGPRRLTGARFALALAVFSGAASMRCLDTLLPVLAARFGQSVGSAGVAVSVYALSYSLCQLIYGPLSDRLGAYRVVAGAACLSALTAAACALVTGWASLVVLRFVAGAIAAAIGPSTLAWVSRTTSSQGRAVALARMTAAAILGTAAGQVGGGLIGGTLGEPFVFAVLAALFAAAGGALILIARARPDILDHRGPATPAESFRPLPHVVLRRPRVIYVLAAVGVECFALYLSLTYAGALLRTRFAFDPAKSGLVVSLYGIGGIAFVLVAGALLKRLTIALRAAGAGLLLCIGFIALGSSGSATSAGVSLFAIGFGFLMLHNVLQLMATDMAPDALATSLSLFAAVASLAQAIGAAAGGYLFDRAGPTASCLMSALILAILGMALARQERHRSVMLTS